jgi:hypothetical protein
MLHYTFRADQPLRFKNATLANPQKIGEAIDQIKIANDGELRPEYLWQAARDDKAHVLYPHFEWDLETAAQHHWTDTARRIIRVICVAETKKAEPSYAFISVKTPDRGTSYYSRKEIIDSAALQDIVLSQAERDLASWEKRYKELTDLCERVAEIREEVTRRRRKASAGGKGAPSSPA